MRPRRTRTRRARQRTKRGRGPMSVRKATTGRRVAVAVASIGLVALCAGPVAAAPARTADRTRTPQAIAAHLRILLANRDAVSEDERDDMDGAIEDEQNELENAEAAA